MKAIFSASLFLQLLVFALMASPGLRADERREFISKTINPDVQKLLENCGREIIGEDVYNSELVAIVFVDKLLLWYESETAKSTLKAKMARLMGKQSI